MPIHVSGDDFARPYLNTRQAAQYLNVSTQFLEIARHRGKGPPYHKLGRAVRYGTNSLEQWMKSNERTVH